MKKALTLILASMMIMGCVACGDNSGSSSEAPTTEVTTEAPTEEITEEATEEVTEAPTEEDTEAENDAPAASGTLGETLNAEFKTYIEANPDATAQAVADTLMANPAILFAPATMPVENGLLSGFGEAEITGFSEGVMFAPMIGSIAFVGYIFKLDDGTDVDAFIQTLKDNADPRWNICVEAEETIVDCSGNTVFFVMCPKSLEA